MPDEHGNPTPEELMGEVGKEEIRHRSKSDAVKVTYMWMAFLAPVVLALASILVVGAANIPSFTAANERLTNTLATMHPWNTTDRPAWSVVTEGENTYLRMDFRASEFLRRILGMGWTIEHTSVMVRVKVPNPTEGELDIKYYSSWLPHTDASVSAEGLFHLKVSQHNLPPDGPPNGTLVMGADYQAEVRFVMGTQDLSFYREFIIQTDWFTYQGQ